MILMLQGNDQISVCNRPGLHSIPHHCSQLLNTTPLLTTAQYHTTAEQWLLLRRWWSSRGSGWQCFKDFLFTITPIWYYINPHLLWSSSPWSWSSQPLSPLNIFPYWAPLYICFLLLKAITQTISLSCYIIIIYIKILHSFVWKISSPCYEYFDLCNSSGSKALQLYKMVWSYSGAKI